MTTRIRGEGLACHDHEVRIYGPGAFCILGALDRLRVEASHRSFSITDTIREYFREAIGTVLRSF